MRSKAFYWLSGILLFALIAIDAPFKVPSHAHGLVQGRRPLSKVQLITMPPVDVDSLLAEDEQRAARGNPLLRFAYPFNVQYNPGTAGTWESLEGDRLLWRLRIVSPGALSLNLGFARYAMPAGGRLTLYTLDGSAVTDIYTEQDNEAHGQLWTPVLPGDEIVVELSLPAAALPDLELELTAINHGYVAFGVPNSPDSGTCNVDVICPEGDPWRDEIRSVAIYQLSGSLACTGALVNNTAQDLTPYFLTAAHCGVTPSNAATVVVYWNYEQTYCRPIGVQDTGDGSLAQYQTGAFWRAGYEPSDFTLVELDDDPEEAFNVHWAGWDRSDAAPPQAVTIHHPSTDEKRISFENDPTSITNYWSNTPNPNGTHIRIADWDLGTTEPGSSGSPLFDENHHIVGQLHGGYAACGNDEPDWYGRLFTSWTGGGTAQSRLSDWLDPSNTGAIYLDGRDRVEGPFVLEVTPDTLDLCAPADATYQITVAQVTPGYEDPVTLGVSGTPDGTTASFNPNPVTTPGDSVLTISNTAAAAAGSYKIDVVGVAPTATTTTTVGLNLFTGAPGQPDLLTPPDGSTGVGPTPEFSWTAAAQAGQYLLEIATDIGFSDVVYSASVPVPNHTPTVPLQASTEHHWRVQANNACGSGTFSDIFSFRTANIACEVYGGIGAIDVELAVVTAAPIYPGDLVGLSADITPDDTTKPYTYTVSFGDGTAPVTTTSSSDPLTLTHSFAATGTFATQLSIWNCDITEAVTGTATVVVEACCHLYLPLVVTNSAP